jgi:hypothetical protein
MRHTKGAFRHRTFASHPALPRPLKCGWTDAVAKHHRLDTEYATNDAYNLDLAARLQCAVSLLQHVRTARAERADIVASFAFDPGRRSTKS